MKQQFLFNTAGRFQTYIFENNRKLVPSEAWITIYAPGGAVLADRAAMDIAGDGLLGYDLSEDDNSFAALNYKAALEYHYDSTAHYATLFYDVVRSRLTKVVTDDDLASELPQLRDSGWSVAGVAEDGSETAIVDSELKRYCDNYFTGGLASLPVIGEKREITGFIQSTGTVSTAPFTAPVLSGDSYILTRSFARETQRAFEKLEERLQRQGRRPHLVLDPYDTRESHIYLSVAEACKGLSAESKGLWWELWKEYERKAEEALSNLVLKYDSSTDGFISGDEDSGGVRVLKPGRS